MKSERMFELASRKKMRFPFKGLISIEDLWDLSMENLDSIFKTLNSQLKKVEEEESLLTAKTKEDEELQTKIEIVKYIFDNKLDERNLKQKDKEKKEQKQKILEVLANKKNEALQNKSIEELNAMLSESEN